MKNKASRLLKQIISLLGSIAKAKSMAIKSKTSAFKARLIMFFLMKNKKALLMGSISNKINNLLGGHDQHEQESEDDQSKTIVLYDAKANKSYPSSSYAHDEYPDEDEDDKYPDLRHSLFDEEMDLEEDEGGSIIELVRHAKEEGGEEFRLEDEIDHVADLFITRFHKQMRMQKLLSFKRYQEMLERSV
ncbi:hypothetical protein SLE2022_212850 [Rubroshorea leprosula]|uniref:Uncharacterized protein n=1 Tax=Rubroshorea leprosula TaxID=152421 RepID=A0AAV5IY90_9ROSI|nr:hypothetical protein SLEP1_g15188 [Rubroshorea leprosula]